MQPSNALDNAKKKFDIFVSSIFFIVKYAPQYCRLLVICEKKKKSEIGNVILGFIV